MSQLSSKGLGARLRQLFLHGQPWEIPLWTWEDPSSQSPAPAVPQRSEDLFAGWREGSYMTVPVVS